MKNQSVNEIYTLNTDGGARGNPGPSACGAVLRDNNLKEVSREGRFIGVATNNEAEYQALIMGLEMAVRLNVLNLTCLLDSELVVKQLKGEYKIKIERLRVFYNKIKDLEKHFDSVNYMHVPRSENSEADSLVNKVLDSVSL